MRRRATQQSDLRANLHFRSPRLEKLEARQLLAGEILSFHLNARSADDLLQLTSDETREVNVQVGEVFHLEVSYEDLRNALEAPSPGALSIGVDIDASLPDAITPVLTETQRLLIDGAVRDAASGQIVLSLDGTNRQSTIDFDTFAADQVQALSDAIVELGYAADQVEVRSLLRSGTDLFYQFRYVDVALAGINLPDMSVQFDLQDAAGDPMTIESEFETISPVGSAGTVNGQALRYNLDTRSRTMPLNHPYYNAVNYGSYNAGVGFDDVIGIGNTFQIPLQPGDSFPEPFDAFSIPVYLNQPVRSMRLSLNASERFDSNLVFGNDDALEDDELLFDPVLSQITVNAIGDLEDSPFRDLYFTAALSDGTSGLFVTNGSTTRLVQKRRNGMDFDPQELTAIGDRLILVGTTSNGERELYVVETGARDVRILANISDSISSFPENLTVAGGSLYFTALRPDGQRELYVTDGDFDRARLVKDLSDDVSSEPMELTPVGDELYFSALNVNGERELYRTNGTAAGTKLVGNLAGETGSEPADITPLGDQVLFTALEPDAEESAPVRRLYVTDGTFEGTLLFDDSINPENLTPFDGSVFFVAGDETSRELFRADETGTASVSVSAPTELLVIDDKLYAAADFNGQTELYTLDAGSDTFTLLSDVSGQVSSEPQQLTAVGTRLAFAAIQPNGERELFRSRGTDDTTSRVIDIATGVSSDPSELTAVGNRLAFLATSESGDRQLYLSDLSRSGTSTIPESVDEVFGEVGEIEAGPISKFQIFSNLTGSLVPARVLPMDVNGDGTVSATDALNVINFLGRMSSGEGEDLRQHDDSLDFIPEDINRDGKVSALDALTIINQLARQIAVTANQDPERESLFDDEAIGEEPSIF